MSVLRRRSSFAKDSSIIPEQQDAEGGAVVVAGRLYKLTSKGKWLERHFWISSFYLKYEHLRSGEDEREASASASGVLDLRQLVSVASLETKVDGGAWTTLALQLNAASEGSGGGNASAETIHLRARNEEAAGMWIGHLRAFLPPGSEGDAGGAGSEGDVNGSGAPDNRRASQDRRRSSASLSAFQKNKATFRRSMYTGEILEQGAAWQSVAQQTVVVFQVPPH